MIKNKLFNQTKGNKMKYLKCAALSLILLISLSISSYPQMKERQRPECFRENIRKQLNLTPEQEKKISDLRLSHQERMIDLNSELEKKELQKEKILSNDQITRNDMLKITNEINEIRNRIDAERMNHEMDVYENLDNNQKMIWKDLQIKKNKMKDRMKDGVKDRMRDGMRDGMKKRMQNQDRKVQ